MYRVTIHYRNSDDSVEEIAFLSDALESIADELKTMKDHWNVTSARIDWQPPALYCHDGAGHVYEHYDREDGNLYCECGARHHG